MEIKRIKQGNKLNIKFYNGISLTEYQQLSNRWDEILVFVHQEILDYVTDEDLCFGEQDDLFPLRSRLTGNYYIDDVAFIKRVNPIGFQIMIQTRLTEFIQNGEEDDYLGLDITLFTKSINDQFVVWGVDSSSI